MSQKRKVVVTGLGVVSSVGHHLEQFWQNITNGKSGVKLIDAYDPKNLSSKIAATVDKVAMAIIIKKSLEK